MGLTARGDGLIFLTSPSLVDINLSCIDLCVSSHHVASLSCFTIANHDLKVVYLTHYPHAIPLEMMSFELTKKQHGRENRRKQLL